MKTVVDLIHCLVCKKCQKVVKNANHYFLKPNYILFTFTYGELQIRKCQAPLLEKMTYMVIDYPETEDE